MRGDSLSTNATARCTKANVEWYYIKFLSISAKEIIIFSLGGQWWSLWLLLHGALAERHMTDCPIGALILVRRLAIVLLIHCSMNHNSSIIGAVSHSNTDNHLHH